MMTDLQLAEAICDIADTVKALKKKGIKEVAIVALVMGAPGNSHLIKSQVQDVVHSIFELEKTYFAREQVALDKMTK